MTGFIAMERDALDHPLLKDGERFRAWFWIVAKACWKSTPYDVNGKIVSLDRGQLCVSRSQLAEAWGWSPSAVERFLTRLETEQMIGRATGQGRTVITVCNYAKYQDVENQTGQVAEQQTGQRSDSDRTTKEQGNKGTSIEEEAKASPSRRASVAKSPPKVRMTDDWRPAPLPESVSELTDQWPPGRLEREVDQFRDYWLDRTDKRPGWDRTFHNRIRDIHDRVLRESRNDQQRNMGNSSYRGTARDGVAAALDRDLGFDESPGPFGRRNAGDGSGNSVRAIAPPRAMW